nr:MAG TPA: phosphatidylinositol-4-OH kinase-like protein [Caudoviricetes sp.]
MPLWYAPAFATCKGVFAKCKGRMCGEIFEIKINDK